MKLTEQNYKEYLSDKYNGLMLSLFEDLKFINDKLKNNKEIYIDYQDYHDEYSPENLEAHDNFGCLRLIITDGSEIDSICGEMTVEEIDFALCIIYSLLEKNI